MHRGQANKPAAWAGCACAMPCLAQLVAASFVGSATKVRRPDDCQAWCLVGQLFFTWVNPFVRMAYHKGLQQEDMFDLPKGYQANDNHERLKALWKEQTALPESQRSFGRCLWNMVKRELIFSVACQVSVCARMRACVDPLLPWQVVQTATTLMGPMFLKLLTTYITEVCCVRARMCSHSGQC